MIEAGDQARSFGASVLTPAADRHPFGRLSLTPFDVVRMALATVLLIAAALKAHQLATEPVAETSLFASRWFLVALVEFELAFGLWLLAGLYSRMTWAAAITCFGTFGAVALYRAMSGEGSCGCFGRVELSPWWALSLDAAAVTALLIWPPRVSQFDEDSSAATRRARQRLVFLLSTAFLVGLPAGVAMASYSPAILAADGVIVGDDNIVVLEPKKWPGRRWPLLEYVDVGKELSVGSWVVVIYHNDCPDCRELLPAYEAFARQYAAHASSLRVALIEMPPYAEAVWSIVSPKSAAVHGLLRNDREWFVRTPVVLRLEEGRTSEVGDFLNSGAMMRSHKTL